MSVFAVSKLLCYEIKISKKILDLLYLIFFCFCTGPMHFTSPFGCQKVKICSSKYQNQCWLQTQNDLISGERNREARLRIDTKAAD